MPWVLCSQMRFNWERTGGGKFTLTNDLILNQHQVGFWPY